MTHPPAPWTLYGHALQSVHIIDRTSLQNYLHPELKVFEPWPGKAIATIYFASYQSGSTLEYNELIVGTFIRHTNQVGGWVTHIYVDNPDSVEGGRNIWGLPKELAEFDWTTGDIKQVTVRQGDRLLCSFRYQQPFSLWRFPLSASSFSIHDSDLMSFKAQVEGRWRWINARLNVPTTSPLADLHLGQPWLAVGQEDMRLQVDAPQTVAHLSQATTSPSHVRL